MNQALSTAYDTFLACHPTGDHILAKPLTLIKSTTSRLVPYRRGQQPSEADSRPDARVDRAADAGGAVVQVLAYCGPGGVRAA